MSVIAKQLSGPTGVVGRVVSSMLARGNGPFNQWLVHHLAAAAPAPRTVVELGSGPGVALRELASVYPDARIVGVDPSHVVQAAARRRTAAALADGRITLVTGDLSAAASYLPADLILAVHVIYFWTNPLQELRRVRASITADGRFALGYQLRESMPKRAQRDFPRAGFTLYDTDQDLATLLSEAGFTTTDVRIFGTPERPRGRLIVAAS